MINHHHDVPYKVLNKSYTFWKENSWNKIIHGDNLEALKSLLPQYEWKIDCIYIDPPYNTWNEWWIYNDNVNDPRIKKWLNEVVGKEWEDLSRHDKWLCMMYPRLKLLQKLLSDQGVLFISIDENEVEYLIQITNEIFWKNNIDKIVRQKTDPKVDRNTNAKIINRFKSIHEYVIICYNDKKNTNFNKMMKLPSWKNAQKNPDKDPRWNWQSGIVSYEEWHKNEDKTSEFYYTIKSPSWIERTRHWFFEKNIMEELIKDNRIYFWTSPNYSNVPRLKTFENEEKEYYMDSILNWVWTSSSAKDEIEHILWDRNAFDTPKPEKLVKEIVRVSTQKKSIILDSFAGSWTTAHAVLDLNKEDWWNRKFILIELMDYADNLTANRVKNAINWYSYLNDKNEKVNIPWTGWGFDFYELWEPLFVDSETLNEKVGEEILRDYIRYSETKSEIQKRNLDNKYYLGTNFDTDYYFYYEKEKITELNYDFLANIKMEKNHWLIIYADICSLSDEFMKKNNIVFKKIPRDISQF